MRAIGNLGSAYGILHEATRNKAYLDSTEYYLYAALKLEKEDGSPEGMIHQYCNLARLERDLNQYNDPLLLLDSAQVLAVRLNAPLHLRDVAILRSECFRGMGQWDSAYYYLQEYVMHNDSVLNQEKVRALVDMQEKYESEKSARIINELELEKITSELKAARLRRTGWGLLAGFVLVGAFALVFFFQRNRISKEKARSEELLLNILPEAVATELKAKGEADAQLIDQATVLFTDFKGFTSISESMSPKELVRDIHAYFSGFDHIIEQYHIEKIKTIGDSYMAAGGIPTPTSTHAADVANAALDIRDLIERIKADKQQEGAPFFEVRIGVHTGPVVAGIVGVKKFAYDIWGDTVNIASRMESGGVAGKVNISQATYDILQHDTRFVFEDRGMVTVKGDKQWKMWLVERAG